jgi:hypothetical protein
MRMLGFKASLQAFRWDLVYLAAQLVSDKRPGVSGLAGPIQGYLAKINEERSAFEKAEDAVIVVSALLNKSDRLRDELLIEAGGVARASDKAVYETLFPNASPSATARLGIAAESAEVSRILGEIAKLPADHPVRAAYEKELQDAEAAVKVTAGQSDDAATAMALQRSHLDRFKLEVDKARLETHGQLVVLLKDKAEAEAFFRPTTKSPVEEAPAESPTPAGSSTPS